MMRTEGSKELTDHEGRGAEDVESYDDQSELDRLDLGAGDDLRGGAKVPHTKLHSRSIAHKGRLSSSIRLTYMSLQ